MKAVILLVVLTIVSLSNALPKHHQKHNKHSNKIKEAASAAANDNKEESNVSQEMINKLNSTVQLIISSQSVNETDESQFLWDLLNPVFKFVLLNQTQVSLLQYDAEDKLKQNVSNMNWESLPDKVQLLLLNQKGPILLSLTYEQWGWCKSENSFSNSTLYSLLADQNQALLPSVAAIISPIQYDLKIDLESNDQIIPQNNESKDDMINKCLDSFFKSYFHVMNEESLANVDAVKRREAENHHIKASPHHMFARVIHRASRFVKSVGL